MDAGVGVQGGPGALHLYTVCAGDEDLGAGVNGFDQPVLTLTTSSMGGLLPGVDPVPR